MGTARLYRDSKPSKSHRIAQPTVPLGPMRFSFETELVATLYIPLRRTMFLTFRYLPLSRARYAHTCIGVRRQSGAPGR